MQLAPSARVTGEQRAKVAEELAARYRSGESIRSLAADCGRSYGFVQGLLLEHEVELRGRGGDTRSVEAQSRRVATPADQQAAGTVIIASVKRARRKTVAAEEARETPTTDAAEASLTQPSGDNDSRHVTDQSSNAAKPKKSSNDKPKKNKNDKPKKNSNDKPKKNKNDKPKKNKNDRPKKNKKVKKSKKK